MLTGIFTKNLIPLICTIICGFIGGAIIVAAGLDDSSETTCFTPGQQCIQLVVNNILASKESIELQAYYLTSEHIIDALIAEKHKGVAIEAIVDKTQRNLAGIKRLEEAEIEVRIDYKPKIAHNKIIIFDHNKVLTGSFNFTANAQQKNAENILITDKISVVSSYEKNFNKRYNESKPIKSYEK